MLAIVSLLESSVLVGHSLRYALSSTVQLVLCSFKLEQ